MALSALPGSTAALEALADPDVKLFSLEGFKLQSGSPIATDAKLAYRIHGELKEDSKIILHPTSFDAVHTELVFNIGPGNTLDTDKYVVIIPNLMGNGVSYSPSNAQTLYPEVITFEDNVRAQYKMLTEGLGLDLAAKPLHMIYGYSMGALQAFTWARVFPDCVQRVAAVCGSSGCNDFNKVFLTSLMACVEQDPNRDKETGLFSIKPVAALRTFGRIYAGWGVSFEFYRDQVYKQVDPPYEDLEDFLVRSYEGGFKNGNASDLYAQLKTWHNAPLVTPEVLQTIKARCVIMPCTTDAYFTVDEISKHEAVHISNSKYAPIQSCWGHRAGDPHRPGQTADKAFICAEVRALHDAELNNQHRQCMGLW